MMADHAGGKKQNFGFLFFVCLFVVVVLFVCCCFFVLFCFVEALRRRCRQGGRNGFRVRAVSIHDIGRWSRRSSGVFVRRRRDC